MLFLSCHPNPDNHARILRKVTIYQASGEYCAWPDLAKTAFGDLIVAFCRSEEHLGPDGQILLSRSTDGGTTWNRPEVIFDTPIDDRESGLTSLSDGRILAHFWSTFHTPESYASLSAESYEKSVLDRWVSSVQSPAYRASRGRQGAWCALTMDGGRTWSEAVPGVDAIHGGTQLKDGTILVASYREFGGSLGVFESNDPSVGWRRVAFVSPPRPDSISFGEPHVLQLPSGRIIMMIRATAVPYNDQDPRCVLWETYSDDRGATWVQPFATPLWGYPPHLALLSDNRVLCTYGYRRPPFGVRACTSMDGVTWKMENETILRDDAPNGDLGYPSSIEVQPGVILTVYYAADVAPGTVQRMRPPDPARVKPGILGILWKIAETRGK